MTNVNTGQDGRKNSRRGGDDKLTPVYVFDFETDPFKHDRVPAPFCYGFYGPDGYHEYWGDDCPKVLADHIETLPENAIIFAHNGGKFDFAFMRDEFDVGQVIMIGSRINEIIVRGRRLRDSFSMIPVPLRAYAKDDIDYSKLEKDVRDQHKDEISSYLKSDCIYLYELVTAFIQEFGIQRTMASAAIKELQKFHPFERAKNMSFDRLFRTFYFGGRVECFEHGILEGDFRVYDVNSEYPFVMRDFEHPIGTKYTVSRHLIEDCDFAVITGRSSGALPLVDDEGLSGLRFPHSRDMFFCTGHEIRAGLETGTLEIDRVHQAYHFDERIKFDEFVDHFYSARMKARKDGDKLHELFYKLVLNSSYGKFAQNPENYMDYKITISQACPPPWMLECELPNDLLIWSRPSERPAFMSLFNVATAASITGAARAHLLRGIQRATRPVYCDTDSIICEHLDADIDPNRLGAWKDEGGGNRLAIAGKKLYSLRQDDEEVKKASKGVRLTSDQIFGVAGGETIEHKSDVPTFNLTKETRFISRKIRATK